MAKKTSTKIVAKAKATENVVSPKVKAKSVATKKSVVKAQTMGAEGHDRYFVYLKNPMEYRRHLLESSRKILYCLRSYQKILLIRQKKSEYMASLKSSVNELMYLNKNFNQLLPKYDTEMVGAIAKKEEEETVQIMPKVEEKKLPEIKPQKTELDLLEESLANIENKLRSLK